MRFQGRFWSMPITSTTDRERAERSRFRWGDDGSGVYRLRLRGLIPLKWVLR